MKNENLEIWYFFLNSLINFVTGSIFWIMLIILINPKEYGIISYIYSFSIFLSNILSLGIMSSLWKYCSENKLKNILFFSLIFLLFGLLTIFFISIFLLNNTFIFIFSIFIFLSSFFENILYGYYRIKKIFISNLISSIIKIILPLLFYFFSKINLKIIFLSVFSSLFIGIILKLYFSHKIIIENLKLKIELKEIKRFLDLSLSSFLLMLSSSYFSSIIVISSFLLISPTIGGIAYFSQIISSVISFLPITIVNSSLPIISRLSIKKNIKSVKNIIQNIFLLVLVITIPTMFLVAFHLETFLKIIKSNEEFINYSPKFFLSISISSTLFILSNILSSFLFSIGKIKIIHLIEILSILTFSLFVIIFSKFGKVEIFLLGYIFVSLLRFLIYVMSGEKIIKNLLGDLRFQGTKLLSLFFLSFFISFIFSSKNIVIDIVFLFLSLFILVFSIKKLKILDEKSKKFIKNLNLPTIIEKIIFKII